MKIKNTKPALTATTKKRWAWADVSWPTALFLIGVPVTCLIALPTYLHFAEPPSDVLLKTILWATLLGILTNLSITAGYHRLYSHRSYEAHPVLRLILLFIGAGAWQSSCLRWSSDHRVHHNFVDQDKDPYAITKGFFYAHFGWMLLKSPPGHSIHAPDLVKDPMVRFQDKYYLPIAFVAGFLFPAAVAASWGDFWGGLWIAGFLRIFLTQQSTYFVNSLSHTIGRRPYSTEISARDSLFVAILTHGEGYHNFHHKFQWDYRNGVMWWQWDPTKWTIWTLSKIGMAQQLKKIPSHEILKARMQIESMKLLEKGFSQEQLDHLREQVIGAQIKLRRLKSQYLENKQKFQKSSSEKFEQLRFEMNRIQTEIELAKVEFEAGLSRWQIWLNSQVPVRSGNEIF